VQGLLWKRGPTAKHGWKKRWVTGFLLKDTGQKKKEEKKKRKKRKEQKGNKNERRKKGSPPPSLQIDGQEHLGWDQGANDCLAGRL
jgi:hypothetical protein